MVPIFIPALRERPEDIPLLAEHFLRIFNLDNLRSLHFTERAIAILASCSFPGNVRELENCVQRVASLTQGEVIDEIDLPCQSNFCQCATLLPRPAFGRAGEDRNIPVGASDRPEAEWEGVDDLSELDALPKRERLIRVMEKAGWVQAKAARMLGMTPRQVGYALRKHKIDIKRF